MAQTPQNGALPERPDAALAERVAGILGAAPVAWRRVGGGYTPAERWLVALEDGRTAFAKVGTIDWVCEALRTEHQFYASVAAPYLPALLGWDDNGAHPLLLLEDLSAAFWPPPWTPERIAAVRALLDAVAATPPPACLPDLATMRADFSGWDRVAADPAPFLSLRLCSRAWLDAALPALLEVERTAPLAGDALLHLDVRSDNLCFVPVPHERVVLVDWNWAARGNPTMDVVAWLPSLRCEGGPEPWEVLTDDEGLSVLLAGFWARSAGLPPPPQPTGEHLRAQQKRSLRVTLAWAARSLGLPAPDGE